MTQDRAQPGSCPTEACPTRGVPLSFPGRVGSQRGRSLRDARQRWRLSSRIFLSCPQLVGRRCHRGGSPGGERRRPRRCMARHSREGAGRLLGFRTGSAETSRPRTRLHPCWHAHAHTHTLKKMFLNDAMFRSSKRGLPSALWASRLASAEPGWLAEGTPKQGIQNWDRPRRATAIWHWRALIDPEQRKVGR